MKVELGGIYRCGESYVRIVADLSGDELHDRSYYGLIGVICTKAGKTSCIAGFFGVDGDYYVNNPELLANPLAPFPTQEDIERNEKLARISKIEKELEKLKESL